MRHASSGSDVTAHGFVFIGFGQSDRGSYFRYSTSHFTGIFLPAMISPKSVCLISCAHFIVGYGDRGGFRGGGPSGLSAFLESLPSLFPPRSTYLPTTLPDGSFESSWFVIAGYGSDRGGGGGLPGGPAGYGGDRGYGSGGPSGGYGRLVSSFFSFHSSAGAPSIEMCAYDRPPISNPALRRLSSDQHYQPLESDRLAADLSANRLCWRCRCRWSTGTRDSVPDHVFGWHLR
jgi:hypothetical protein